MKTILLLLISFASKAQVLDTVPQIIPVIDTTDMILVYNKDGKLVKRVPSSQGYTVPRGGWAVNDGFINIETLYIKGYVVYSTDTGMVTRSIDVLDSRKMPIPSPYVQSGWTLPINGTAWKQ